MCLARVQCVPGLLLDTLSTLSLCEFLGLIQGTPEQGACHNYHREHIRCKWLSQRGHFSPGGTLEASGSFWRLFAYLLFTTQAQADSPEQSGTLLEAVVIWDEGAASFTSGSAFLFLLKNSVSQEGMPSFYKSLVQTPRVRSRSLTEAVH